MYEICDEEGQGYEFVVEGEQVHLTARNVIDPELPMQLIMRFAKRCGFTAAEAARLVAEKKDYEEVVTCLEVEEFFSRLPRL